jgi:serine/threonine-protein kinase
MAGFAIGTPQYMSPEQARGAVEEIGPASDIYSLGATLYVLLVGRPPHEEDEVAEMLKRVEEAAFAPPRSVNHRVPRALEAVVLKAMAREPADRYTSARELAGEIERWMADEPVTAHPESPATHCVRWLTRHRVGVTAVGVAGLVALIGLGILSLFQTQANLDLSRSYDLLARANANLSRANTRASDRFSLAQEAIDRFQTSLSENAQLQRPELRELRQSLVDDAIQLYRRLEALIKSDTDPNAQDRLARAYESLAALSASVERRAEAKSMLRQAVEIRDRLAANLNPPTELTLLIVRDLTTLARMESEDGRPLPAKGVLLNAEQRLKDALRIDPDDADLARERNEVSERLSALQSE